MLRTLALLAIALALASCSSTSTDNFISRLANFNRGVAAVDETIAQVSATLYKNCKAAQAIGQSAVDITGTCAKASQVVTGVNAVIQSYCQRDQVTDIPSAVSATASTVNATKSQLVAAKAACAKGG